MVGAEEAIATGIKSVPAQLSFWITRKIHKLGFGIVLRV